MNTFDLTLFNVTHAPAGRWFLLDWLDIFVAVYLAYFLVVMFLILVIREKNKKRKVYALAWATLGMIVSRGIIAHVIYFFYHRPRPFEALGIDTVFTPAANSAFPSGHMAAYAALILPTWYLNKKWGVIYLVSIIAMGIARVYGAVHWPTDIIGGMALALAVSYGVKKVLFKGETTEEEAKEADITKILD